MKIMVDADEYEQMKKAIEKLESVVFGLAGCMRRLDILQDAGFELLINGVPIENERSNDEE